MECGIRCIQYLALYYLFPLKEIYFDCMAILGGKGISIYDMIQIFNKYGIDAKAYFYMCLPKEMPLLLYLRGRKSGHYIVLLEKGRYYCRIYDPVWQIRKVAKWKIYLMWSHIGIVLYANRVNL